MPAATDNTREKTSIKSGRHAATTQEAPAILVKRAYGVSSLAVPTAKRDRLRTMLRKVASGRVSFTQLFQADFPSRQAVILDGLPAKAAQQIARDMGVSNELVYVAIGAPRATVNRQLRKDKPLSPAASERAVFLAELVNIVKDAIPEENTHQSNFDPAQWVGRWIANPLPALGGATPTDYLATGDGRTIVKRLLNNTLTGDYA